MVRAATWLHFGSGGAARARVSTTVTPIPRHARSIASLSPTGPAPTIRTSNSVTSAMDRAWKVYREHDLRHSRSTAEFLTIGAQRSISVLILSLIHISEPTRLGMISYAVFCLKK